MRQIQIIDSILCKKTELTFREKLEIARKLERLNVQVIELPEIADEKADTLLIHCYAGQSRSRAVGAFALKMLGGDNSRYFTQANPNMHVYETLEKVWKQDSGQGDE